MCSCGESASADGRRSGVAGKTIADLNSPSDSTAALGAPQVETSLPANDLHPARPHDRRPSSRRVSRPCGSLIARLSAIGHRLRILQLRTSLTVMRHALAAEFPATILESLA